jgi:hypothetical protein
MTYKEAISYFELRYNIYRRTQQPKQTKIGLLPVLDRAEILTLISAVQKEIGNDHKLIRKNLDVVLASDTNKLTVGNRAGNIPADILDIKKAVYVVSTDLIYPLVKCDERKIQEMRSYSKEVPEYYCWINENEDKELWFDTTLNAGYTVRLTYYQKLFLFNETLSNSMTNTTWSDYDITKDGYGGYLKIPNDFDELVIEGALAKIIPSLFQNYILSLQLKLKTVTKNVSNQPIYKMN